MKAARFRSATVNCEHRSLFIVPKALFIATKGRSSLQATLALHVRALLAQNFKLQTSNFKLKYKKCYFADAAAFASMRSSTSLITSSANTLISPSLRAFS